MSQSHEDDEQCKGEWDHGFIKSLITYSTFHCADQVSFEVFLQAGVGWGHQGVCKVP